MRAAKVAYNRTPTVATPVAPVLDGDFLYSFGPYVLDPVRRVLRRAGITVSLRPKTVEVLLVLVEHRAEILAKDILLQLAWPDSVVEENNLARHISTLRRVFQDAGDGDVYIITVPLRGYRFVAPVSLIAAVEKAPAASSAVSPPAEVPAMPLRIAPPGPIARGRYSTLTWLGLVTALVIIASLAGTQARPPRLGERNGGAHRRLWQLTFSPGVQDEPAWSSSGEWIAYSSDRDGNADVWIQPIGQETPRRVTSSKDNDWQPAWSPDNRYLAFRSEREGGGLYVVQPDGRGERKVSDFGYRPRWSPDSSKVLFYGTLRTSAQRWTQLFQVGLDGTEPVPILAKIVSRYQAFHAAWHPGDGRISVFGTRRGGEFVLVTASEDGSNAMTSTLDPAVASRVRDANVTFGAFQWSPRGDSLYFEGTSEGVRNIWRIGVDPATLAWTSGPERLTTGAELNANISLSADGKRLAFSLRSENTRLWSFPYDSQGGRITGPGEPFTAEGADAPYDVSSDGRRLVYRALRRGKQELWERTLASGQDRLLLTASSIAAPHFSHDGTQVVYRRDHGDSVPSKLIVAALDLATRAERVLTVPKTMSDAEMMAPFDWSRDGRHLLASCSSGVRGTTAICTLPTAGASPVAKPDIVAERANHGLFEAQASPDGSWICFNAVTEGRSAVYAVQARGGEWIPITQGMYWDDKPRWSPDGRVLYFTSARRGFVNVWARRFDPDRGEAVGEAFAVTNFETPARILLPRIMQLHVVLADKRIILPMVDVSASVWVLDNVDN